METNISRNISVHQREVFFWYKIYDLGPEKVFTVHSRGMFTKTNCAISPTEKYRKKKWDRGKVFTKKVFTNQ